MSKIKEILDRATTIPVNERMEILARYHADLLSVAEMAQVEECLRRYPEWWQQSQQILMQEMACSERLWAPLSPEEMEGAERDMAIFAEHVFSEAAMESEFSTEKIWQEHLEHCRIEAVARAKYRRRIILLVWAGSIVVACIALSVLALWYL